MKLINILFACILLTVLVSACGFDIEKIKGNGKIITKEIKIEDYDKIEIAGNMEFNYSQSNNAPYFQISIDENILDYLKIYVQNKTLFIEVKNGINLSPTTFIVNSNSTSLKKLEKAGSGTFNIVSELSSSSLSLSTAGSGNIICKQKINVEKLEVDIAGSAKIYTKGNANKTIVNIAGSGRFDGSDCNTNSLVCNISGSGNVYTSVKDSLSYDIAGSGVVTYIGDPKYKEGNISGSGKAIQKK